MAMQLLAPSISYNHIIRTDDMYVGCIDEKSMRLTLACCLLLRLHTKEVGKDLGAAGAMKALRTSPLDKYQRLSVAFRKRHGLGLSMDDEGVLKSWGGSKIESNEAEEYLHSEVWWEEQRRKRKGRRKGASFPIRLGSVLMRRRQWVKGASLDDSDLESEEGEDQDERMENSFDVSSSDDLESEEGTTHDILLAPTHLQDYNYQNDEEKDGYDDDMDDEWDVKENGDDEWVQKDSNEWDSDEQGWDIEDKCHLSSDEDDERWDHQVDQCDDFQEKDWSDDDEMVETNEDPAESPTLTTAPVEQWGCSKDPLDRSKNWSCAAHRYGGGIHDKSNQNFENLKKRRGGESAQQQQREGVWDSDEDEWRFSRRKLLEEDNSEEYDVNSSNEDIWDADESSVGSDDEESDEPPWNYDSSNDDHHDVMSSYSHEEEIDFAY